MKQQISLREANQHLSRYIEAVQSGDEIIITRRGKPVAKLVKFTEERKLTPQKRAALERLFSLNWKTSGRMYSWEELYDERLEELACVRTCKP